MASSHRSTAKYSVDDNDSSSEPIYQGIVEMDIGAIRKVSERMKPFVVAAISNVVTAAFVR